MADIWSARSSAPRPSPLDRVRRAGRTGRRRAVRPRTGTDAQHADDRGRVDSPDAGPSTRTERLERNAPPNPLDIGCRDIRARRRSALINWDTAAGLRAADYAQVIVDAGDPSGTETAALASDVRTYLPTADAWLKLRTYGTRQWLTIDEAFVPASWSDAIDQATLGNCSQERSLTPSLERAIAPASWGPGAGDISTDRVHSLHRVRAQF